MGMAFVALFVSTAVAYIAGAAIKKKHADRDRANVLEKIAEQLDGAAQTSFATGRCNGVRFGFRFETRGSGSNTTQWTEIDAALPAAYPLVLHVRRHSMFDRARVANGTMVDVNLGDKPFDDAFLVEAAPADIARTLIDERVRAFLTTQRHVELTTEPGDNEPLVRLAIRRWTEDLTEALAMIDLVTRLAAGVRDAFAAAEGEIAARETGSPYRPALDDAPAREAADARAAEVAKLEELRASRAARATLLRGIFVAAFIAAFAAYALTH